jgi:hypothetical protein
MAHRRPPQFKPPVTQDQLEAFNEKFINILSQFSTRLTITEAALSGVIQDVYGADEPEGDEPVIANTVRDGLLDAAYEEPEESPEEEAQRLREEAARANEG